MQDRIVQTLGKLGVKYLEIKYFNRVNGKVEVEKVFGDAAIKWMYRSFSGKFLTNLLIKAPVSQFYGYLQTLSFSKDKIPNFIEQFKINMDEFLPEEGGTVERAYSNFNAFFIRRFKDGKRPFVQDKKIMPAFAEARYFGYESIQDSDTVPVKGKFLNAHALLMNNKWEKNFQNGPLLLARLCPVDYHRYHYPDNGKVLDSYRVTGKFHSVNPLALKEIPNIFAVNERQVTIIETENFGKLAYVEVGAMMVGKIIQSHMGDSFKRGDEKGYFLFGGSTVIVIGEKGKWRPSDDILKYTKEGIETYLQLGLEAGNTN